ncbi:hypothetical protein ACM66B_006575 [Microbotryomycetes sp. NB124-2]
MSSVAVAQSRTVQEQSNRVTGQPMDVSAAVDSARAAAAAASPITSTRPLKRARDGSDADWTRSLQQARVSTSASMHQQQHQQHNSAVYTAPSQIIATPRRVESVVFAGYEILPAFPSPYPFDDNSHSHSNHHGSGTGTGSTHQTRVPLHNLKADRHIELDQSSRATTNGGPSGVAARAASTPGASTDLTPVSDTDSEDAESAHHPTNGAFVANLDDAFSRLQREDHGQDGRHRLSRTQSPSLGNDIDMGSPITELVTEPSPELVDPTIAASESAEPAFHAPPPPPTSATNGTHSKSKSSPRPSGSGSRKPTRGQGGRFAPKPGGSSAPPRVRKPSSAPRLVSIDGTPRLTQKELRELTRRDRDSINGSHSLVGAAGPVAVEKTTKRLFVCEGCFKYMLEADSWNQHRNECTYDRPPGRKVYENGSQTIYEVDGAVDKLYCQNLCLFGKLFIEHKYIFFDVEGFMFYIITEKSFTRDSPVAYFSKEKNSYDDYNLACIVTFPPYRQNGWATLLIEFSYEITRRFSDTPGTPERPLSDLGLRGYLNYWTSVLVRYFQQLYDSDDPVAHDNSKPVTTAIAAATVIKPTNGNDNDSAISQDDDDDDDESDLSVLDDDEDDDDDESVEVVRDIKPITTRSSRTTLSLRRNSRGQATMSLVNRSVSPFNTSEPKPSSRQTRTNVGALMRTTKERRGGGGGGEFTWPTTLERIAYDVNLRPDDVSFALVQSGLAKWRRPLGQVTRSNDTATGAAAHQQEEGQDEILEVVVTKELVSQVARDKKVKPKGMLDLDKVLL